MTNPYRQSFYVRGRVFRYGRAVRYGIGLAVATVAIGVAWVICWCVGGEQLVNELER